MARKGVWKERWTLVQIAVLTVVMALCVYGVVDTYQSVRETASEYARRTAVAWTRQLFAQSRLIGPIMQGQPLGIEQQVYLRALANVGGTFAFKIYAPDGTLMLNSDAAFEPDAPDFSAKPSKIVEAVMAGSTHVVHETRRFRDEPENYVRAYIPFVRNGEIGGIAELSISTSGPKKVLLNFATHAVGVMIALAAATLLNAAYCIVLLARLRRETRRMKRLASHDSLTGLVNRAVYWEATQARLASERKADREIAIHIVDLDGFKTVNDTLGHAVGDQLLKEVACALLSVTREDDVVARLGGDEFVVLQANAREEADVVRLGQRIVAAVDAIEHLGELPVDVSASVGSAYATPSLCDAEILQVQADVAVYRAKELGRNQHVLFIEGMDEAMHEHQKLRRLLREALARDLFILHFQPLHDATDERLVGFEALLRLRDLDGGLIGPGRFIPVAEEMKLTGQIGGWVLREACAAAARWPGGLHVSVNLSPQQVVPELVREVQEALTESGLNPARLELEITESLFLNGSEEALQILQKLKGLGAKIVLDDFGIGYSSLSYLWKFPFDKLKVDRSCFGSLGTNASVPEVLRTITQMADAMDLVVTAEGIETKGQLAVARRTGYDELQGFLYSEPMPADAATAYMERLALEAPAAARSAA